MRQVTTTHEWSGYNLTVADLRKLVESLADIPEDTHVCVTASSDQRDGDYVKFTIREDKQST